MRSPRSTSTVSWWWRARSRIWGEPSENGRRRTKSPKRSVARGRLAQRPRKPLPALHQGLSTAAGIQDSGAGLPWRLLDAIVLHLEGVLLRERIDGFLGAF